MQTSNVMLKGPGIKKEKRDAYRRGPKRRTNSANLARTVINFPTFGENFAQARLNYRYFAGINLDHSRQPFVPNLSVIFAVCCAYSSV
jgi:hypothetical protein